MISYIFAFACLACLRILIYCTYIPENKYKLTSKIATSSCFLLIALSSYLSSHNNFTYFIFIFLGLIFSFLGDIFLGIKGSNERTHNTLFLCSLISFSITHIFYSISFVGLSSFKLEDFIFSVILAFILLLILKSIKGFDFKNMFIPICIYSLIIAFMVCKAVSLIFYSSINIVSASLISCGAVLFMLSDYILAFVYFFKGCSKTMSSLNLITYYLGQILLALSILYI